jgi:hypothetical protein
MGVHGPLNISEVGSGAMNLMYHDMASDIKYYHQEMGLNGWILDFDNFSRYQID